MCFSSLVPDPVTSLRARPVLRVVLFVAVVASSLFASPLLAGAAAQPAMLHIDGGAACANTREVRLGMDLQQVLGRRGVVTWEGGSIIIGTGAPSGWDYPSQTAASLSGSWSSFNVASPLATLAAMSEKAAQAVDPHYDQAADLNVCVVMGGAWDLHEGMGPPEVVAQLGDFCRARRAAGFKVVVLTVLPRNSVGYEEVRQQFNVLLRQQWQAFADALADVAADGRVGDASDCYDPTYYSDDWVHLNAAGYAVMAQVTKPVIDGLDPAWQVRLREVPGVWSTWAEYHAELAWLLSGGDGVKTVEAEVLTGRGDVAGSSAQVLLDTAPPVCNCAGGGEAWTNTPVTLTFSGEDGPGGSGVAELSYSVDGGSWLDGATCAVSSQGHHEILCRATDRAGNVSASLRAVVNVDSVHPSTKASPSLTTTGSSTRLRFRVDDPVSSCGTASVTVEILRAGKIVKSVAAGVVRTNTASVFACRVNVPPGRYIWRVRATDAAGNAATGVHSAALVVRPR
jgi:lysophospholipase L1-like esterase